MWGGGRSVVGRIPRDGLVAKAGVRARYEQIADALDRDIASGRLRSGERLPTVRELSVTLGVSGTTVAAAYNLLSARGRIRGQVGKGTFVAEPANGGTAQALGAVSDASGPVRAAHRIALQFAPWRKRTLTTSAARLRAAHFEAIDCSSGRPDPALLPLALLQHAWQSAVSTFQPADLQYASPEPIAPLVAQLLPRLEADGVAARRNDLVVGSSAQQLMVLALEVAAAVSVQAKTVVAVEEPGYPTIFDTFERAGHRLVGVEVDADGVVPNSLDAALASGVTAVLLTPRAHNPTGASWTPRRRDALADVLAAHPGVVAIEDDQFAGISTARPGSLLTDPRIEDRVIYIRSFSKSIAPDLRITVAAARPRLRALLLEAKSFADGWTSRTIQRVLAEVLADATLDRVLAKACADYAARREAATAVLSSGLPLHGGWVSSGTDGVNVWVHLPPAADSLEVVDRVAALGVLIAPGEPFFIRPGRSDVIRLNAGAVEADQASEAAQQLVTAASTTLSTSTSAMAV